MSRADEIAQGLREPSGALTFALVVEEYAQGIRDYEAGAPPPRLSTPSYDLGRARAAREADTKRSVMDRISADRRAAAERTIAILREAGRPDLIAEFEAEIGSDR